MNQPPMPPPRVPQLPIAQLIQKMPSNPPPETNAYDNPAKAGDKGGLPLEICAFAQSVYMHPQMQPGGASGAVGLEPGWGGKGR